MNITPKELDILRKTAHEYMQIASLPCQRKKMEQWKIHNNPAVSHGTARPMILIDQLPWNELNCDDELTLFCQDPFVKEIEFQLKSTIYKWKHFPADMVVEPFLTIPYCVYSSGYGIQTREHTLSTDSDNPIVSHNYVNQLQTEEDLDAIQDMEITVDRDISKERLQLCRYIFDGILPVRQAGNGLILNHLGIWDTVSALMSVESVYYDLIDRPEFLHSVMQKMTNSLLHATRQLNELGLIDTSENLCHCSVVYNDEQLPDFGAGTGNDSHHAWAFGLAQLFTSVSPEITEEFELPYISLLANEYQMLYYGCCERLDDRLDIVQKIPKVRKISCSPWSDRDAFAEKLHKNIIMSAKPTPAFLAAPAVDYDAVSSDLRRTCEAARRNNVTLEFILKDVSTVMYHPERLTRWAECAMKVAEEFA